jgi:hemerythrin-like domain-containing protein
MDHEPRRTEPGLALRMQRERRVISSQHRQLDDFTLRLAAALDAGEATDARAAFQRFSDALEAHLALEDGLYFPALRQLRPNLETALESLSDEHEALRERLTKLARLVESGRCDACLGPLERFAGQLADHEGREEGLLASLRNGGNTP